MRQMDTDKYKLGKYKSQYDPWGSLYFPEKKEPIMIDKDKVLDMIDSKIMEHQKNVTQSLREVNAAIGNQDVQGAQSKSVDVAKHQAKIEALNEIREQIRLWTKPQ